MYTDEQLEQLEQEEHEITLEAIAAALLIASTVKDDLERELRSFYQKYGKDGVVTYQEARKWISNKDHRRRNTIVFLSIGQLFDAAFKDFEIQFESHLRNIIKIEADYFGVDLDIDDILNTPWGIDDLTWRERLFAYRDKWVDVICNDFKTALLKRSSIDDVVENLVDRFDSIDRIFHTLYITETTATGSISRKAIFKEVGVKKYRFYTREDERTCNECGSLHGLIFPISAFEVGVTASPIHPRCRCWEVPIID